jgi:hypothetical protein
MNAVFCFVALTFGLLTATAPILYPMGLIVRAALFRRGSCPP